MLQNCSIACRCDILKNYGEFCQFSRQQSVFSKIESLNIIQTNYDIDINFQMEVKPCLIKAWQQSNTQFICPVGYEMLSNITDRCFNFKSINTPGFTKSTAEYDCNVNGGALVSFETPEKLNLILNWLSTKTSTPSIYWTSTAISRNASSANHADWSWVWASKITNMLHPISYDNWAPFHANNFNGDSVYLNSSDLKYYVGLGSQNYSNQNTVVGLICESNINGLSDNQLNILELKKVQVFTSLGQSALKVDFLVNITLNDTSKVLNQITSPNSTIYSQTLKNSCSKHIFFDNIDGKIFTHDNIFSIDICGSILTQTHLDSIKNAILNSWLVARPGI